MKAIKKTAKIFYFLLAVVIGILLLGTEVSAANNSDDWRPVFDLVMDRFVWPMIAQQTVELYERYSGAAR